MLLNRDSMLAEDIVEEGRSGFRDEQTQGCSRRPEMVGRYGASCVKTPYPIHLRRPKCSSQQAGVNVSRCPDLMGMPRSW
jgi:hypothetical protein